MSRLRTRHLRDNPIGVEPVAQSDTTENVRSQGRAGPIPTATGETLLVRRDGDSIARLSPLRFDSAPPLTLTRPENTSAPFLRKAFGLHDLAVKIHEALAPSPDRRRS